MSFVVSAVAAALFALFVAFDLRTQFQGAAFGLALGAMAVGAVIWSLRVLVQVQVEDKRDASADTPLVENTPKRASFLQTSAYVALGALSIALLFPFRALAPAYGSGLYRTKWRPGARVVRDDGTPLRPTDIAVGSVMTVFPEGAIGDASSATLLLRLGWATLQTIAHSSWCPRGCIAFSKVCTHAGCPVGVYRQSTQQLLCPCHQSVFDVARSAAPVSGPATRPLPQLPLVVGSDGYLRASSDYLEPVGPGFWNRS
ncbi:MAG TPA: Rieske 2Fe-2S domain-containing protein [Candidatus Eremiobacteraceae bacterium]|nr:Rieske 2Fe-2S domain-containing protein [Candidatus Eremiobacteraceae bacterium]